MLKSALLVFILINSTLQTPVKKFSLDDVDETGRQNVETKNWKLNSQDEIHTELLDDDPPTTYRLPNNTRPVRYDIWLKTDIDKADFSFEGRVQIQIRAVEVTNSVTLQYRDMTIKNVDLIDLNGEIISASLDFVYVEPVTYEFLRISLPREMNVDEEFILDISYNGTLKTSNAGFYRGNYNENDTTFYYAVTQFESTDARHAFPCYDEPAIRAPMGLKIQHDESYSAHANMPIKSITAVEGTTHVITQFEDTPPVQTYLLAFLVSPFEYVSNNDSEIEQRIFAKPQSIRDGEADFANSISDAILKKFISHFGVNFTLPKLDHAAIPQFAAGAMENWGFITYRESALLLRSSYTPAQIASNKRYITEVIAHEVAHQWTGDLVSPNWWSDLWLNEGFATLFEYYIPHLIWPNDGYEEEFRTSTLQSALRNDLPTLSSSVPMSYYVETPRAIDGRFNWVSYAKSGTVLKMFQEALSVETFTKGLNKYFNKMSLKAAIPQDLFSSIQEAYDEDNSESDLDISSVMSSWTTQAGYPLVSVSRSGNNLTFSQMRYPNGGNGEIYSIPLSFATRTNPDFDNKLVGIWLKTAAMEIPQSTIRMSDDDWIVFNVQQTGYYRMSYDSNLWHAIASGLNENYKNIHFVNRRILQEELNLGYSTLNTLLASDVLEVVSYLINEDEYLVWNDANSILRSLNTTLFGTSIYSHYLNFIQSITQTHLDNIGFEATEDEPTATTQLRIRVKTFNCYSLDEKCLNHELQKLIIYMQGEANSIPDFCSAFRLANSLIFEHYLNELADNLSLTNRNRIVANIGCSLNEDLLGILVTAVEDTDNALTTSERLTIMQNMMTTSAIGFQVVFNYLRRNYESISSYRIELMSTINTQYYFDELNILINEAVEDGFMIESLATSIRNSISLNLAWQDKHLNAVKKWFGIAEDTTTSGGTTTTTFLTTLSTTTAALTTTSISSSSSTAETSTITTTTPALTSSSITTTDVEEETTSTTQASTTTASTTTTISSSTTASEEETTTTIMSTTPDNASSIYISIFVLITSIFVSINLL